MDNLSIKYIREKYGKLSIKSIAKHLNKSVYTIIRIADEMGLTPPRNGLPWEQWEVEFLQEYYSKMSVRDIAHFLSRSESSVYQMARKLGLHKWGGRRGCCS